MAVPTIRANNDTQEGIATHNLSALCQLSDLRELCKIVEQHGDERLRRRGQGTPKPVLEATSADRGDWPSIWSRTMWRMAQTRAAHCCTCASWLRTPDAKPERKPSTNCNPYPICRAAIALASKASWLRAGIAKGASLTVCGVALPGSEIATQMAEDYRYLL